MPVLVDLYGVVSLADVAVRFERAYAKELRGAIRGRIEEFLQKTGLGLSLGAFGISARLQLEPKTDPLPALHALLDLPLRLEESGGFRALHRARRVPGRPQGAVAGRAPAQPHPVPGRGRLLRLRRLRARADEAALRAQGGAALRLGGAAAARAPARRRPRRLRRRPLPREQALGRRGAQPAARLGEGPPAARDAAGPPALGGGRAEEARRRSTTGSARTPPHSTSCSPSSRRSGAGSTPPSRRRCARSSPARARPTARPCSSGSR